MRLTRRPLLTPFVLLFLLNFFSWMAINATSLIPPYIAGLGASPAYVGLFNNFGNLAVVLAVVIFGRSLVKWPRVQLIRLSMLVLTATSVVSWVASGSLEVLSLLRIVGSVGQVFASTLLVSVLLDVSPPEKLASRIAIFSVAGMLTNPFTSFLGELLTKLWGAPSLFAAAGLFAAVTAVLAWGLREPTRQEMVVEPHAFHTVVRRPDMRLLLVLAFVFGVYYNALVTFFPSYTQTRLGDANLSAFLTPFSIISVVIRLLVGSHLDKRPPRGFLLAAFFAVLLSLGALALPVAWGWIILAGLLYGAGHSILYPLMNSLFVVKGGVHQKAVYSNAYMVANLLGAVTMTPLLGAIKQKVGFEGMVVAMALLAVLSLVLIAVTGDTHSVGKRPEKIR